MDSAENELLNKLKDRIRFTDRTFESEEEYERVLNSLLEDSKYIALSLYAPYEDNEISLPKKYDNWLVRCSVELFNGMGTAGLRSYAENGLSWTRDSDYISKGLRDEIEPLIGVIVEGEI